MGVAKKPATATLVHYGYGVATALRHTSADTVASMTMTIKKRPVETRSLLGITDMLLDDHALDGRQVCLRGPVHIIQTGSIRQGLLPGGLWHVQVRGIRPKRFNQRHCLVRCLSEDIGQHVNDIWRELADGWHRDRLRTWNLWLTVVRNVDPDIGQLGCKLRDGPMGLHHVEEFLQLGVGLHTSRCVLAAVKKLPRLLKMLLAISQDL